MKFVTKMDADGKPVFANGLITLVNEDTDDELAVNPAQRHAKCLGFETEAPQKNADAKVLSAKLTAFEDLQTAHPDIFADPVKAAADLAELTTLREAGPGVDEQITALHTKYGADIDLLKTQATDAETAHNETVLGLKRNMQTQQYLIPWASSEVLKGYALPRDPGILESVLLAEVDGKSIKFQDDGTVLGWDGAPIVDHANDSKPVTDPEKILEVILAGHPRRDKIKLSGIPGGGNMSAGAGGDGADDSAKFFVPAGQEGYNLSEQLKVKAANPALYAQLKGK